jgi:uncharacterized membrane protein (DUF2068 family)
LHHFDLVHRDRILPLIGIFRLLKAALLIVAAMGVLHAREWVRSLPYHHEHALVTHAVAFITRLPVRRVHELAIALVVYSLFFTIEGVGLLMRRLWAEWLTIIATTSFIPFEIYEVVQKVTVVRAAAAALNVIIVIYLIRRRILRENSHA